MRHSAVFIGLVLLAGCFADSDICDVNGEDCQRIPAGQLLAIDGDTYQVAGKRLRLAGWDSPETASSAKCRKEHELGLRAEAQAKLFVSKGKTATIQLLGEDQYQRAVARIWVDGTDIGKLLEVDGLAVAIHKDEVSGKADWCASTS